MARRRHHTIFLDVRNAPLSGLEPMQFSQVLNLAFTADER
jgi:hypothetical protein